MKVNLLIIALIIISSLVLFVYYEPDNNGENIKIEQIDSLSLAEEPVHEPIFLYGFNVDTLLVIEDLIQKDQSLSDILLKYNISHQQIFQLAERSKEVFDVRKINAGRKYTLLCSNDSLSTAKKLIYEPSKMEYVVFNLDDSLYAQSVTREVTMIERVAEGTIEHSLSVSMDEIGAPAALTNQFVDVFAWQVDFFALQKGDHFKVLYVEQQVDGEYVGIDHIIAIYFEHFNNPFYAFSFDQGNGIDYFDEKGNSIRKALLRYPLEFSRISSRYSLSRFHPVQKRYKAHLGTDFAAATGTPIRSVGDGIVVEAQYSQFNGNYVKIRHNATYTTQYLHMSKIASGIKAGVKVRQSQTIGFVGSTGLATGSHLCYRFWKNGVQVDALGVKLPPSEPLKEELMDNFKKERNSQLNKLMVPVDNLL